MSTQVQYRRGTTAENDSFTGALAEITVVTTNGTLRVHDGVTPGGYQIIGATATQTLTNKIYNGTSVSVSGNVAGGNLTTAGSISATGNVTSGNLSVSTGNVSLGNLVNNNSNGVGNIGSSTTYFNTVFAKATSAQYADVAERYLSDELYPVGTVLVIGGPAEVTQSTEICQTNVAGTVSENPGVLMNRGLTGQAVVDLALLGRVPCRVKGDINKGDLLMTSDTPGVATKVANYQPGCVIGKALESHTGFEESVIEILVGRL